MAAVTVEKKNVCNPKTRGEVDANRLHRETNGINKAGTQKKGAMISIYPKTRSIPSLETSEIIESLSADRSTHIFNSVWYKRRY
ncbi:hypothetical protein GUJ93_ZPchr0006g42456 [Zizania palustris]|uniref:Uncharacterized protein n=1 Tax=Zizania palustris TaxID=103762 RepID=A0A8J5SZY2_ZIZPA|nr:hypothetical protein GUJ93_ZPchr0006g42456 [Zizania palustris]